MAIIGRLMKCKLCAAWWDVIEAATGATTLQEHQWVNPEDFLCPRCVKSKYPEDSMLLR